MGFYEKYLKQKKYKFNKYFNNTQNIDIKQIKKILGKQHLSETDLLTLLSPAAEAHLEKIAQRAHQLTIKNFGRVMLLYAPLYVSNYCQSSCLYCGFNVEHDFSREKLTLNEVNKEAKYLRNKGFQHLLLLTGCSRNKSPVSYLQKCVQEIRDLCASLSLEIYALEKKEYQKLVSAGVDGLTIYQEVYDQKTYKTMHPEGPKSNYQFRLNAPERACQAGMRTVNIGSLLGLNDWREEAFFTALHANYLQNKYPGVQINVSVPRLQPQIGQFNAPSPVSDKNLVQIILAYRLFLPRLGINLSTRESAELRNNVLPLGITKISAESSTKVGGYTVRDGNEQFSISDQRNLMQIKNLLKEKGYQPVFKDWHQNIVKQGDVQL